ncbi:MAG: hypothetical protein IIB00_00070 [candidate division Zixibacteria bacterium]|nr:hypothetical protein [candidate division Zixibacteria bacterium]
MCSTCNLSAQQISREVYPTEVELFEAFIVGDIEFEEYLLLVELLRSGDDFQTSISTGSIPNIDFVGKQEFSELGPLQREQADGFRLDSVGIKISRNFHGSLRIYTDQELNESQRSQEFYRLRIRSQSGIRIGATISGGLNSPERWRERFIEWRPDGSRTNTFRVGSFSTKWGLGLALGRRRSLLDAERSLGSESFLFPDRGAQNGIIYTGALDFSSKSSLDYLGFGSTQRDSNTRIESAGLGVTLKRRPINAGALFTFAQVVDRRNGLRFKQFQYSGNFRHITRDTHTEFETSLQSNNGILSVAAIAEGRRRIGDISLRLAGWAYPGGFTNLLGAGRSGLVYESIELETARFSFTDRRNNQRGFLLRSVTPLGSELELEMGIDLSGQPDGDWRGDYLFGVSDSVGGMGRLSVEFSGSSREINSVAKDKWRLRTQILGYNDDVRVRAYIEYREKTGRPAALGLFGRIQGDILENIPGDLWLNFSEVEITSLTLRRFTGFVRVSSPIFDDSAIRMSMKINYRYNKNSSQSSVMTLRLELNAVW